MIPAKTTVNNYVSLLAAGMPRLIKEWRAEMQGKSVSGPEQKAIEEYMQQVEGYGIPALHLARIVLACEWVFRARRITEVDIEDMLAEMEDGLHKDFNPVMTDFQAHLMIKAIEPQLRKQLIAQMPVVPLVFEPTITDPNEWFRAFSRNSAARRKRTKPTRLLRNRSGQLPMPGPRVAAVIVEALAKRTKPRGSASMGTALCTLLLGREVQGWEFKEWRDKIIALPGPATERPENLLAWLMKQTQFAYDQSLLQSPPMSPETFLQRCETDAPSLFFWLKNEDVFRKIISTKWTNSSKNTQQTRRNRH